METFWSQRPVADLAVTSENSSKLDIWERTNDTSRRACRELKGLREELLVPDVRKPEGSSVSA